ncbi:MAG: ABC transporter substrate-binding protein, partial [Eubacterium sp.]
KEPEKIVSLSPANTEILFALGVSDKMVGRTDYDNYPEEAAKITSIGDFNQPNIEKIISMSPDLILGTDLVNDDVRRQVEATGAKVAVFSPQSVDA